MSAMEIGEETKKRFKVKDRLIGSLNIVYNESNSMFMFWNKYQVFVYEDLNFENPTKVFVPEFQIYQLINSNNYLVCLDFSGNVHTTSLKFKNSAQKRFRSSFQPRDQGILICTQHSDDTILTLKFETDGYFLCLHRINAEFQLEKKVSLRPDNKNIPLPLVSERQYLLYSQAINKGDFDVLKDIFNVKDTIRNDYSIVLISFDKVTVYGCIFSPKIIDEEIPLIKLYTSPSEICDIKIIETDNINVIIGLTIGTIIKLPLTDLKSPDVIHLNIALFKFLTSKSNDTLIYSDGMSLWKTENTLKKNDINFLQFFVKHIKDFIKFGDQLICTTYTNMIYAFPIEDETAYIKNVPVHEYVAAERLLNNSEYLYKIMKEIEKSNDLSKKLNEEGSYITALALSRRQDIMDKVIQHNVVAYESYKEAIEENPEVGLTEEISHYFQPESYFFLIKLTSTIIHHTFNNVLSNLFGDLKIHINLSSNKKLLKTTSIKLNETLKKMEVLIPLNAREKSNVTEIDVDIKIVTNIPGSLDENQEIWTVLYRKIVVLNSEHFIKTNMVPNKVVYMKEPNGTIDDLIMKTACNHHGNLFKITDITNYKLNTTEWSLYVKLPNDFQETLQAEDYYKEHFIKRKADFFLEQFTSEEFLKSKTNLCFEIGNEKVKIEILHYFSRPLLKVSSRNMKIAFNIRNFLANLIHNFRNYVPGQELVNYGLYTTIENLQKAIKNCILSGNEEEFLPLTEIFYINLYGTLPL